MEKLSGDDYKRLDDFLSDQYYVYVLFDGTKPFYVGKGKRNRCSEHEKNVDAFHFKNDYEFLEFNNKDKTKSESIAIAKHKGTYCVRIIKFGLTEDEAFMCESALINCLKTCGYELKNIANGHSSGKEKISNSGTKSRTLRDILYEYCPEETDIEGVKNVFKSLKDFNTKTDDVALISFNKLYPKCNSDIDYWEAIRGCWVMSDYNRQKIKYIFAVHNNVIKGIYKVKNGNDDNHSYKVINAKENFPSINSNDVIKQSRKDDFDKISKIISLNASNKDNAEYIKEYGNYCKRVFFATDITKFENDSDLQTVKGKLLNKYIKGLKMPQISVKILFR